MVDKDHCCHTSGLHRSVSTAFTLFLLHAQTLNDCEGLPLVSASSDSTGLLYTVHMSQEWLGAVAGRGRHTHTSTMYIIQANCSMQGHINSFFRMWTDLLVFTNCCSYGSESFMQPKLICLCEHVLVKYINQVNERRLNTKAPHRIHRRGRGGRGGGGGEGEEGEERGGGGRRGGGGGGRRGMEEEEGGGGWRRRGGGRRGMEEEEGGGGWRRRGGGRRGMEEEEGGGGWRRRRQEGDGGGGGRRGMEESDRDDKYEPAFGNANFTYLLCSNLGG